LMSYIAERIKGGYKNKRLAEGGGEI